MFTRIRHLLAAFDRGDFDEAGLSTRLDGYLLLRAFEQRPPLTRTVAGMPVVRVGP